MSILVYNDMRVYGEKNDLSVFRNDVALDYENGPLSFQNVIEKPQDTYEWKDQYRADSHSWECLNWGCPSDALWPNVKDEGEFLSYTFSTQGCEPLPVYELLIDRYSALDFEIYFLFEVTQNWGELATRRGELSKKLYMYWECIPWRDRKYKDMLYRQDLIKDTLQVVEERIFYPGEYDDGTHMWVKKV